MNQPKFESFLEATGSAIFGFTFSLLLGFMVYPMYGAVFTINDNFMIGVWFFFASVIRQYVWRRICNRYLHPAIRKVSAWIYL